MIAPQHHDVFRCMAVHDVDVLEQGIRRALVPFFRQALLCRQDFHELADLRAQETPGALQVTDQGMGLVLGEYADAAQAGVDAVGQGEVDDAVLAAEGHGGLGPPLGQPLQSRALAAGENQHQGVARDLGGVLGLGVILVEFGLCLFLFLDVAHDDTCCWVTRWSRRSETVNGEDSDRVTGFIVFSGS